MRSKGGQEALQESLQWKDPKEGHQGGEHPIFSRPSRRANLKNKLEILIQST